MTAKPEPIPSTPPEQRGDKIAPARSSPPAARHAGESPPAPAPPAGLTARLRAMLDSGRSGAHAAELTAHQRDVVLARVAVLIWISVIVMPTAILTFVWSSLASRFVTAVWIVGIAIAAVLLLLLAVRRGLFHRRHHLAMLLLVGGVFGPTASAIIVVNQGGSGDFFFSYFLIYFAFTALFPADLRWVLATSGLLVASYIAGQALAPGGLALDHRLTSNLIYFFELTFIGSVLNRVLCRLFFDERLARIQLSHARDALFAEMEVAQEIQTLLLPDAPALPGHTVRGIMLPATEVGGDYWDVLEAGGRRFLAVGDVSGHGVTSGLTMMMARASLLGTLEADPRASLPALYAALNRCLRLNLERMKLRLYMTLALVEDLGNGRFRAVGGHLPALIHRKGRRDVEEIELAGVWLGVLDQVGAELLPETDIELAEGDTMLLCTDGVVERMQGEEMFGFVRLSAGLAAAAHAGPSAVVERILGELEEFGGAQEDDMTLLVVQCGTIAPLGRS